MSLRQSIACLALACAASLLFALSQSASAAAAIDVEMTPARWQLSGHAKFLTQEDFVHGLLEVDDGNAVLAGTSFVDGIIEFDMRPTGQGMPSIQFRRRDAATAEEIYFRPYANCRASSDCVQYTPVIFGENLWDMYPDLQTRAPIDVAGWNHVKIVVHGRRMNAFFNDAAVPLLAVNLQGQSRGGGIQLHGPATFANLTITPGAPAELSSRMLPDATLSDARFVRAWSVSKATLLANGVVPAYADMPDEATTWKPLNAEQNGLVNLARRYPPPPDLAHGAMAWVQTRITSRRKQVKHVHFGFTHVAFVFLNGKLVFSGRNIWDEPATTHTFGRLTLDNASFDLPLAQGTNRLVVALADNYPEGSGHFSWGMKLRFDDLDGATLAGPTH